MSDAILFAQCLVLSAEVLLTPAAVRLLLRLLTGEE